MNVFRSFNIPASLSATAVKIADALGYPERGMFRTKFNGSGVVDSDELGVVSSGWVDDTCPLINGKAAIQARLSEQGDSSVTEQEIDDYLAAQDVTDAEPFGRMARLSEEVEATVSANAWVQPVGAEDAYALDAVTSHNDKTWVSLTPANVWEPGVSGWRETWGTASDTPPNWIQPTGAHDAYPEGFRVTHSGSTWTNTLPYNVFEPGVTGWTQESEETDEWAAGVAYAVNDQVTYQGSTYRCLQAHTSQAGWEPPNVPALWELL